MASSLIPLTDTDLGTNILLTFGYATLALVYLGVCIGVAWVLRRLARVPLELPASPSNAAVSD